MGTDKATAEGQTYLEDMLLCKILKIAMQIEPFYSIWARIHYILFFLLEIDMLKDLVCRFFS